MHFVMNLKKKSNRDKEEEYESIVAKSLSDQCLKNNLSYYAIMILMMMMMKLKVNNINNSNQILQFSTKFYGEKKMKKE